ncbi:MAG: energy transducer TonB, partial [Chitinophagaceae bacterium]
EELKEAKIDVVNQEGIKDENIATPVAIDEGKQIVEEKKVEDENKIFDKVEIEASFPGGDSKWRQYLERNANGQVATDNGAPEGTYTTVVQFVVDKEGNISDVRSLTNHGYGMEDEAMRVIRKGPKWTPAVQNGRQVKAYRKQPITFQVQSE